MPFSSPKNDHGGSGGGAAAAGAGGVNDDDMNHHPQQNQKLQAVVLADSFLNTFRPLSLETPKVLCKLNNVKLLDYSMDFLAGNGVEEVFVVCTSDQLYEQTSSLSSTWKGRLLQVVVVKDTSLTNAGDALRALYRRNEINSNPFVLLFGDVVTNMDLTQTLQAHKERHDKDSASIMTVILQSVGETHSSTTTSTTSGGGSSSSIRPASNDLVVGLDPFCDNRILLYDNHLSSKSIEVPCSFLTSHSNIEIRTDLIDTGVCVCSPAVLGCFEDAFDFLDISNDFVSISVAEEEEGLQNKIHAHILSNSSSSSSSSSYSGEQQQQRTNEGGQYAARIVDYPTYHKVSQDLLRRWCYPIVPDNNSSSSSSSSSSSRNNNKNNWQAPTQQQYKMCAPNKIAAAASVSSPSSSFSHYYYYKEIQNPSKVARSSIVQGPGMMGSSGSVGEHSWIRASVLGHGFEIGNHVTIHDSHLWDNIVVEDHSNIVQSIVANDCVIREKAVVSKGCVLGPGVVIGTGVVLPEFTRLTLQPPEDDPFADDDDDEGFGFGDDDDDDDDNDDNVDTTLTPPMLVSESETTTLQKEYDYHIVGPDGMGYVWTPPPGEEEVDDDDDDDLSDTENEYPKVDPLLLQSLGYDCDSYRKKRLERQAEDENDGLSEKGQEELEAERMESEAFSAYTGGAFSFEATTNDSSTTTATTSAAGADSLVFGRQKGVNVVQELKDICLEFEETSPMENLAIELNSYKFSQNASYSDCTMAAMLAIVDKLHITPALSDGKLVAGLNQRLEFWAPLLQKMSIGQDEELAILYGLERAATSTEPNNGAPTPVAEKLQSGPSFRFVLQTLHDKEVLSEEAILAWAEERKKLSDDRPLTKLFRLSSVQDFLEWLEEEEDSDDDDSDEESEEDSD